MVDSDYRQQVFINVPFDAGYHRMFEAIVFAVADCGYVPCCARERDDGAEIRFSKLIELIRCCRFGIHDLSCTELDKDSGLPEWR